MAYHELLQVMRGLSGLGMDEILRFMDERKYPRNVTDAAIGRACGSGEIVHAGGDYWRIRERERGVGP